MKLGKFMGMKKMLKKMLNEENEEMKKILNVNQPAWFKNSFFIMLNFL